jgi:hypothetical protein
LGDHEPDRQRRRRPARRHRARCRGRDQGQDPLAALLGSVQGRQAGAPGRRVRPPLDPACLHRSAVRGLHGARPEQPRVQPPDDGRVRHPEGPQHRKQVLLRRGPGRPRPLRARDLRHAYIAARCRGRHGHSRDRRCRAGHHCGLFPRARGHHHLARHRSHPVHAADPVRDRDRGRVLGDAGGVPRGARRAGAPARDLHHLDLLVALHRAHRARQHPFDSGEGVHRSKPLPGRKQPPHHVHGGAPEPRCSDHRLRDPDHPEQHLVRGRSLLPGPRSAAEHALVGSHAVRRGPHLRVRSVADDLSRCVLVLHDACVQPPRGWAEGCARPEYEHGFG